MERLLENNYVTSLSKTNSPAKEQQKYDIQKCAKYLEEKALRSCMIVNLYRKAMLKSIAQIRRDTFELRLNENFEKSKKINSENIVNTQEAIEKPNQKSYIDAGVQTDSIPAVKSSTECSETNSLEEKIKKFERKLKEDDRKRKQFSQYWTKKQKEDERREQELIKKIKYIAPPPPPTYENPVLKILSPFADDAAKQISYPATPSALLQTPIQSSQTEDSIAKELQALFGAEDENNTDIFGECTTNNPQIKAIFTEIDKFSVPEISSTVSALENDHDMHTEVAVQPISEPIDYVQELKDSLWPCELHMQRVNLQIVLSRSRGLRHNEKIKQKFLLLFGEDSDDEFGPYSPSMELNEILIASCKKRIAPWIVKCLMKPMKDGLIANRFLFKKLAKSIAENIIYEKQYPGNKNYNFKIFFFFV